MKKKAIIISGPTASGKSSLALDLVRHFQSVIINADSRQIYKSVDIIVGKDIPESAEFISHIDPTTGFDIGYYAVPYTRIYLTELLPSLEKDFSVAEYIAAVASVLTSIEKQSTPIFVGGSNFYIQALSNPPETLSIPQNALLRKKLSVLKTFELKKELERVDPQRLQAMNNSDSNNPRRLIRAIEIGEWKKKHPAQIQAAVLADYEVFHIGLVAPLDLLRQKIDARVDARIAQGGVDEATQLFKTFSRLSQTLKTTNGYKELFEYCNGETSYAEAIQKWKYAEYHNAKKQLTWIHGDSNIHTYSITDPHFSEKILQDMLAFITE